MSIDKLTGQEGARESAFITDLAKLDTSTLLWIYTQIYAPADSGLTGSIEKVLWGRCSREISVWPAALLVGSPAWVDLLGRHHIVAYCPLAVGHLDPAHRPYRELIVEPIHQIECSCGKRTSLWRARRSQRVGSARVWPIEIVDGIPNYIVCPDAKTADDPQHAPTGSARCICGLSLDPDDLSERNLRLRTLPAY